MYVLEHTYNVHANFNRDGDKIQAEFAVFESIADQRNWLHHIFIRGMRVPDVERKFGVPV
jgi:hypothetical protein